MVASIYYGVAQWPIDEIRSAISELNAKKSRLLFARYAVRAHHRIERVEIPMGEHHSGVAAFPVIGQAPYPVVIMLPGMDTFKEKLVWGYGDKMLERGFAALAIDGPGQSEASDEMGCESRPIISPIPGELVLAWIDARSDLDQQSDWRIWAKLRLICRDGAGQCHC